jgi:hypothetical protein
MRGTKPTDRILAVTPVVGDWRALYVDEGSHYSEPIACWALDDERYT